MEKFNLHEHIIRLQDKTLDFNELDVSSLTTRDIDIKLNYIIENLSDDPLNIKTEDIFDNLQSFIKNFDTLKSSTCNKLFDTVILGSNEQIKSIKRTSNTMLYTEESKSSLEMYGFLIYWLLDVAEQRSKMASQNKVKVGKGSRKITSEKWDWRNQCVKSLELMKKMLFIDINNIWVSQSERDTFINLFTKSIYQILEDPENVKDPNIKDLAYNIICICVKNYNHGFGAQTSIFLNLQSYDHLSEPMAELLYIMCTKYEVNKVIDDILIEISKYEFNEKDITSPKYFSKFLVKLSQILPRAILKKMVYLQNHLDADSYSMRMGMIEVIGNVLRFLISEDGLGTSKNQIYQYIGVLQERFADINSFCRSKVLQVLIDLCEINEQGKSLIPITKRNELVQLAVGRLYDKSSNVRKYAIKFLTKAVDTHPYNHDHRRLILSTFEEQLEQWELKLKEMKTKVKEHFEKIVEKSNENDDDNLDDDDDIFDEDMGLSKKILNMSNENEKENEIPTEKHIKICELFIRSYEDGIEFIHLIEDAVPTMCKLLASTSKPEVLEVMDFFVRIHYYQMECAEDGIKKMIHLIWVKDTNEEGKSIKDRLIESYQKIYFEIPDKKSEKDRINSIVRNLVSLTFHTTLAELTSLEQLLSTMMARNKIPIPIISKLWKIFTSNRMEMHKLQRRGALIILGMLAKADVEIISDKVDMLINVGFGTFGKKDLLLAKYTCIALQHYAGNGIKQKKETHYTRLPMSHPIFKRMLELLQEPTKSNHWYSVAEQVINTIYLLSEHPDLLCGGLIQKMSKKIFLTSAKPYVDSKASSTEVSQTIKKEENVNEDSNSNQEFTQTSQSQASGSRNPFYCDPFELSKLLFVVGHTAIKQIVHLENIENELKRRKSSDESNKKDFIADDIEQCVGSTEDEFTDVIQYIREREILYGKNSLLAVFGPMVTYICAHNKAFNDKHLQTIAVLTLSKFMCVSSEFCEQNLQLLFTILEKSEDSTIRSNISIALGDMTICFNNLIDQNIAYLYNRLNDTNSITKKNVLMVLTHLILNGMVKVKGQISEMAKCLENKDERISDLAKLFFTELSTKDNAVYNNLPDIISNLSSKTSGVSEEEFKNIMKYLFSFIDKDRQTENIIEKLCGRFKNTVNERQWRDISYCLSLLSYKSEKTIKKLFDQLKSYQDKLYEPTVHKCFLDIITKSKKQAKNDAKIIIEEFEEKLEEYHKQSVSHQKTLKRATGKLVVQHFIFV
ncbi:condensin complex subunit 1 [Piromyces finnis]|uniref:Condensin complex subunit 1 n=1 Tax=Piromyces finnis TaxID=1754191 RepID=A0A1Y1UXT7_9FUNG|nr:condensin complex subunit 1 [Piromyces finnis]|eukprot:ORX43125.1 condensin complex subunit 1 [Piromyces finnis]